MKSFYSLFLFALSSSLALGQVRPENVFDTLVITDYKLDEFSVGQTLTQLSDSVITAHRSSLTDLLEYTTPIYFKENGLGMVSSPSFRGTTAQQTAVLWNGININSVFLGQTDFNTINTGSYDNIAVRAGGGSVIYGSGAIGGTVHLNTTLHFKPEFKNFFHLGYGSFNTLDARYRLRASNENISFRFSVVRSSSDNDFKLHNREGRNLNGQFHNTALNAAIGIRLNPKNQLNFYSGYYGGLRHFSVVYPSDNKTKYRDLNMRNLLEWESRFGQFESNLKAAFLSENYQYYPDINAEHHTYGKAETFIGKYDLSFKPNNNLLLDLILSHQHTNGQGSNIEHHTRDISAVAFLFKHQFSSEFRYQLGVRKELTSSYESPFLYTLGLAYEVAPFYTAKLSASRNFRRPTFNDLYWQNNGDPDLKAEESMQIELGNTFRYHNWELTLTGYFNDIDQMIHWIPQSNGLFAPHNIDHVQTYGAEALLGWQKHFSNQVFKINGTYAYTISKNIKTDKQLIYVPYHKATFSVAYTIGRFTADYQLLYNGEVFTRTDNDPKYNLKAYSLSNFGLAYTLGKENTYVIGGRVRNIFDCVYQNVKYREMPGINFNFYLTLNF